MTKRYIEEIYATLRSRLTDDCYVTRVEAHLYDGKLLPGITYMEAMDQDNGGKTNTTCWVPDKQLTIKQLVKLLAVWEECVIKEKSSN